MSKGYSGLFAGTRGANIEKKIPVNKKDYNKAGSSEIKDVTEIDITKGHSITIKGNPNSVVQKRDEKGNVTTERYYDEIGNAYLDIDYSDHGNPKTHPTVPHQHRIIIIGNRIKREKGERIRR